MIRLAAVLSLTAFPVLADTVFAARTIRAQEILGPEDVVMRDVDVAGAAGEASQVIGREARVALYAGRPIRSGDIGAPSVVERNQIIPLIYAHGVLRISTDGRALDRAGEGDRIRVMNLSSRTTVTAIIDATGAAHVSQ